MFTQHCFIRKNTPELRKKLEELGYEPCHQMTIHPNVYKNIAACNFFGSKYYGVSDVEVTRPGNVVDAIKNRGMIDCGDNEDLFLALAALRDDSDYMQWFVSQTEEDSPKVFIKSTTCSCTQSLAYTHRWDWRCSKATVEEIIEYFKKGETK